MNSWIRWTALRKSPALMLIVCLPFLQGLECSQVASDDLDQVRRSSTAAGNITHTRVAMDGNGNGMLVYAEGDSFSGRRIAGRYYDNTTGLGGLCVLAGAGVNSNPEVTMFADSSVVVVWAGEDQISMKRIQPGGCDTSIAESLSRERNDLAAGERLSRRSPLVMSKPGTPAFAVWREVISAADRTIQEEVVMIAPQLSQGGQFALDSGALLREVAVAASIGGTRAVAYLRRDTNFSLTPDRVYASVDAGAGFASPTPLDDGIASSRIPALTIDAGGDVTAMWLSGSRLFYSRHDGNWSPALEFPHTHVGIKAMRIAADDSGNVTAVVQSNDGIFASRGSIENGVFVWQQEEQLNSRFITTSDEARIALAVSPTGAVRTVWTIDDGRIGRSAPVFANNYSNGAWQGAEQLPTNNTSGISDVARDASGTSIAVWPNNNTVAHFVWLGEPPVAAQASLTTILEGDGNGTVSNSPTGSDCGQDCQAYGLDTLVTLSAQPDATSQFDGFGGDMDCDDGRLTMDMDKNCTATFTALPQSFALITQFDGTGTGMVVNDPVGVDCGLDCENYAENTVVTLNPLPDNGSAFAGFAGDMDCDDGQVTMDMGKNCVATFNLGNVGTPGDFVLSFTSVTGNGTVATGDGLIDCPGDCSETYADGTSVTLFVNIGPGASFLGWGGDCDFGMQTGVTITMENDFICTAMFSP